MSLESNLDKLETGVRIELEPRKRRYNCRNFDVTKPLFRTGCREKNKRKKYYLPNIIKIVSFENPANIEITELS